MLRALRLPIGRNRERPIRHADIQGNVLRGYALQQIGHQFLRVDEAGGARGWLRELLPQLTTAERWADPPPHTRNVAVTHGGAQALGAPTDLLESFPAAFRDGMAARAASLGDVGPSAPTHWDAGLGTGEAHVLISTNAVDAAALDAALEAIRTSAARYGLTMVSEHQGARLPDRREHFGYVDGIGEPALAGSGVPTYGEGDEGTFHRWHDVPAGEIFHGRVDADGYPSPAPAAPYGRDGTFVVWRKLHQDVARFRTWVAEQSSAQQIDEELLKAKLVGRWADGTPLALSPDRPDPAIANDDRRCNAFDYRDDPDGLRCPLGAHIRRANPRASLGFGDALNGRQRIIRRGTTYGPALPDGVTVDDGQDRGIFFVAFMADIERQYELIQRVWCNDGDAVNVGHDPDPIIGHPLVPGDRKMTIPGPVPRFVHPLPSLVTTRGGEYLWMPSLPALRALTSA